MQFSCSSSDVDGGWGAVVRRQWAERAPSSHTNVLHPADVRIGKLDFAERKGCATYLSGIWPTVASR
jgi:hypothetical protein